MFLRSLKGVEENGQCIQWGGGTSHRLVVHDDAMGFAVCHTVVWPDTEVRLEYKRHLEACYCISGIGEIIDRDGNAFPVVEGTIYVLDKHDAHTLKNSGDEDWVLVSIFNPPLKGVEKHTLSADSYSGY